MRTYMTPRAFWRLPAFVGPAENFGASLTVDGAANGPFNFRFSISDFGLKQKINHGL
jgi:hypothetical protein